ncbi:molecular chaperone DnaJ [Natrinema saccharevitans]|uniref:Molecular chaperone DnaJ n=1 Tax=Natrinema saccharevitans TaxID=301967 RepID=A0A1S8AWT8_9EURY|nr:J domain-containing protein [Natrinema saccharevitans]OLZ41009.1 molecular chaperone DnaJ [Natrinema saccharevitans]
MAVVGERRAGCDGCGRTISLEDLTAVTMPDGERVACCPECEPHARAAARKGSSLDQRRAACDGCTDTFLEAELEDVVLSDGTVLTCCPSCAAEAPGTDVGVGAEGDGSATDGSADTTESDDADDRTRCTQCREWVTEERFRVTTIDERTERLCSGCKADAEERGIVTDVAMRKIEAREVLGVERAVSDDRLREAFHEQVKRAHPDRKSGSESAFKLVRDAYDRLRDED